MGMLSGLVSVSYVGGYIVRICMRELCAWVVTCGLACLKGDFRI